MIGLGTFYNALGVVFGGLLGLLIGQRLSEDFHETLLKVTGVAVFVLGIAGTLKKMLVVHGSHVESHGSMMLILSLVIGTVIGELLKIEEGFDRFKRKGCDLCSGSTRDPSRFDHAVGPFDRTDHDPTSPFESVPSWLQPHSLCWDQPHLGQTNQGRQPPSSSVDCHYLGFCWVKNRS